MLLLTKQKDVESLYKPSHTTTPLEAPTTHRTTSHYRTSSFSSIFVATQASFTMRAAILFTLLLTLVCLASGNSVPSFVRMDEPACYCNCRPGRRGRRRAFRECRDSDYAHCEVTRCELRFGRMGWWCCGEDKESPTPMPSATMPSATTPPTPTPGTPTPTVSTTPSATPTISMTATPSVTPSAFPRQPGVLCLRSCGVCADFGCRQRDGGRDGCCPRFIRRSGDSCTDNSPPCVLD